MSGYTPVDQGFPGGFTVLMAVCGEDDPKLFTKALASVFDNDLLPDQSVLVVDGPIKGVLDKQVKAAGNEYAVEIIRLAKNEGLATALNAGLAQIQTAWIVRADADDYNLPQRFRRLAELIRSDPELDLAGSAILELEQDGTPVALREMPLQHDDILRFMKRRNPFNHMTIACRRALVECCGGYPDIYRREDYALWAKMVKAGARCANLPEVLVHATGGKDLYRRRGGLQHVLAERDIQNLMVRLGLKSQLRGLFDGIARASVFIAPVFLRKLIYEMVLRRPPITRS
ncbi:MAG: lipooligosaccharide biosynthesis galactosyltransferase LsgF [Gammaproteobacteria bacterium]|nr:MAG: lipooligosaccharide biosynthesis galactosyltransferase LsgF [Gammaproteobacteria bacterium]